MSLGSDLVSIRRLNMIKNLSGGAEVFSFTADQYQNFSSTKQTAQNKLLPP
jgi:hypothetical protein